MATTRLMPLHTGKGRTVGQAISACGGYMEPSGHRRVHNPCRWEGCTGWLDNKPAVRA